MEIWRHWRVCAGVVSTSWWLSVAVTSTLWCLFLSICAGEFRIPCHPVSSKRKTANHFSQFETTDWLRGGWNGGYLRKIWFQHGWLTWSHSYRSLRTNTDNKINTCTYYDHMAIYITLVAYLDFVLHVFSEKTVRFNSHFSSLAHEKSHLFCSFYVNRIVMFHPLFIACSQIGALHISPGRSPEYHDSCWRCEGRRW